MRPVYFCWTSIILIFVSSKRAIIFSSGPSVTKIESKTLATGLTLCNDWEISIDLKLSLNPVNKMKTKTIFSLQVKGVNYPEKGSRIPSLFIMKGRDYIALWASLRGRPDSTVAIIYGFGQNHNGPNPEYFETKVWYNFKLSRINGRMDMKINNKIVKRRDNIQYKSWDNVDLVMGSTSSNSNEYVPAQGEYRNFEIKSCQIKGVAQPHLFLWEFLERYSHGIRLKLSMIVKQTR